MKERDNLLVDVSIILSGISIIISLISLLKRLLC